MKYLAIILAFALLMPAVAEAKGSSGGRSGGGSRSYSSPSRSASSTPKTTTPSAPKPAPAPKVSSKPSASTKTVDAPSKTTSTGKKTTGKAAVVDDNFKPKIKGGYTPPVGSKVQYVERSSSFIDYLPWLYIFSQSHRDNVNNQEAVVTEPDGTEKSVVIEEEGTDGLLILNWIIMIALAGGLIYGIMWGVNKFTNREQAYV